MSRAGSTEMKTNCRASAPTPAAIISRLTCDMSYRVVGQISGQYMKPKNRNDQRESSDLRSNTPLASSISANSAKGLRSGKVISAGGSSAMDAWPRVCQSVQYPPATNDTPKRAPAARRKAEMRCRVAMCGKILAPKMPDCQSDNGEQSPSIIPDTFHSNIARLVTACIRMETRSFLAHDGASFFQ